MPEPAADLSLRTSQRAAFALPCTIARGIAYLSDPAVILGALPSVERVIHRQRGTYRVMLAPIRAPGIALRPAAEVVFTATERQIRIQSIAEEPHDLQPNEVATQISGLFILTPASAGCQAHASLQITATISASNLPPLMPRIIAQRTAEAVLTIHIKHEVQAMTQALVRGYLAWEDAE